MSGMRGLLVALLWSVTAADDVAATEEVAAAGATAAMSGQRPNIVVVFTDDQGYGDLSCYGSQTLRTPRIDSLAQDGTRFTSFYAQVVCGPSRSALLTGRYPARSLGWSMPSSEVTLAELLKQAGYATGCIGKWDVSNRAAIVDRMPNAQGFDYYWGTLGANDNGHVVLHENNERAGETRDMASLTKTYTDKGIEFLKRHRDQPFLLLMSHTMVHSVIDASPEFRGRSKGGLYGDTVEELDFHTGRLLDAIDELGLRERTLVIFTTDNGAWNNLQEGLRKKHSGQIAWGSSGPLREGKGSTYEGGLRVPCLARWPGHIPAGRTSDAIFSTIDFLPTFAALAGVPLPTDRYIDGVNQCDLLGGSSEKGARNDYFYYCRNELHAVRRGPWKLLLSDRRQHYDYVKDKGSREVELYDLENDIGEQHNLASSRPEIVRELLRHATSIPLPDARPDARISLSPATGVRDADRDQKTLHAGDWEQHGLTVAQREQIRSIFHDGIERRWIPGGSVMLIHRGEVILKEAYGLADLAAERPFRTDTLCRVASLTKPHTATLMVSLAEQGLLSLDEPVSVWLPEFQGVRVRGQGAAIRAPTLRECLSHTAGFPGNDARRAADANAEDGETGMAGQATLGAAVTQLAGQELLAEPGKQYAYSGFGYMVAGRVAEVLTGRSFQDLLRRHLLEPLGAVDATFVPTEEQRGRMAVAYERTPAGFDVRRPEDMSRGFLINPGGGLISSLDDVGRLMLLHRNQGRVGNRQVVSAERLADMYVAHPATPGTGYGLGFNILKKRADGTASRVRHTGASGTLAVLDFDQDLIVIVLTQVPSAQNVRWRNQMMQVVAGIFDGVTAE